MGASLLIPTAVIPIWPFAVFSHGEAKLPLRAGDTDEESRSFFICISPKCFRFDAQHDNRVEFQTFAFVDCHDPYRFVFGEPRQCLDRVIIEFREFGDASVGLLDNFF